MAGLFPLQAVKPDLYNLNNEALMTRYEFSAVLLLFSALCVSGTAAASRQQDVTGGPRGPHPYLFKSVSTQPLLKTAIGGYQWSITAPRQPSFDTIRIIALRVEFNNGSPDTSQLKTGDGLFGLRSASDAEEYERYISPTTVYKYDNLFHDSLYFASQLRAVAAYYTKVSRGRLTLRSTIYPARSGQEGYAVPQPVIYYSPGGKKKKETWDEYYYRKTRGLMFFVRDAITAAAKDSVSPPFASLRIEPSDSTIRDENNLKTVVLLFHAGSSYLTDGGTDGSAGRNTPSDMIDAFIDRSWFKMFKKELELTAAGVAVEGAGGDSILLSELMLCSETSNQDGLNWGIQGILVNQLARQLGIPDLFSTSSGISAIGAFCIMDFAGYSAGNGFIPPYPSAWVRAFAGWDNIKTPSGGGALSGRVKALTSCLDRDSLNRDVNFTDTTILLVPVNDHEYYLAENRQRNLAGNNSLFRFDSVDVGGNRVRVIAPYPYNVNIDSNVAATSGAGASNVILAVKNNDVCLPAAGVLVWHVDENIIRDRLGSDLVNADSLYRGVALVEADGVFDLGITFSDIFYQAAYDYGGAEDVFPHRAEKSNTAPVTVSGFGPYTAPSSKSNDGGNTYLRVDIQRAAGGAFEERSAVRDYTVLNMVDSVFLVSASWEYGVPGWPKFAAPEGFFDPLLADLDPARAGKEFILLSKSGRLYAWSTDTADTGTAYGNRYAAIDRIDMHGDTVRAADSSRFIDSIAGAAAMPSAVGGRVFIPARQSGLRLLTSLSASGASWDTVPLGGVPSSYVCGYRGDSSWAVGCEQGRVVFGKGRDTSGSVRLASDSAVCAVAALRDRPSAIAVIQLDGTLSLCSEGTTLADTSVRVPNSIGPYTLVTGDLDRDSASEIVVCDSRHGLWVYKQNMSRAPGWEAMPSDWPSVYSAAPQVPSDRSKLAVNLSPPMLADLNRDGRLDIVVGGTNGLYAFNYKGVLVGGWPSYLDNRFWYQRGSVVSAPIAVTGADRQPLVVFSSPTGERATYSIAKIDSADKIKGMVWFRNGSGAADSVWGLSASLIDTLLTLGDSLVAPYVTPGGFIDAVNAKGKRPLINKSILTSGTTLNDPYFSSWPLTTGSSPAVSPLAGRTDGVSSPPDLFAVSTAGWVYRWRLAREIMPDSLFWPEVGFDAGRAFAYGGGSLPALAVDRDPLTFFSYPNPTAGAREVMFKYKFSSPASDVRLDVITFSGFRVFSSTSMGAPPSCLTGSWPDWNEFRMPVDRLAPGLFRCRMEATINGKKQVKYWKLAVTK
jgi:hypothetical protein